MTPRSLVTLKTAEEDGHDVRQEQPPGPPRQVADISNEKTSTTSGVTFRVVVIALLLAAGLGYIIPIVDYKIINTYLGSTHLPPAAVGVLLMVMLVFNPILRLTNKRWMFSRNETIVLYITCLFSALIPGRGGENFFLPVSIASFYLATPENGWMDFLKPYIPSWMTPALSPDGTYQAAIIEGWYSGGLPIPWAQWCIPLLAWTALIFSLYFMLACLAVLLRRQWTEHESLTYPLLRLPLEMTEDVDDRNKKAVFGKFFQNPSMWLGFGIVVFIQVLNGLNLYFPDVPRVPLTIPMGPMLRELPWNQMGGLKVEFWPIAVAITYLISGEIAFSLWFVFLMTKLQLIVLYYLGMPPNAIPYPTWTRGYAKSFIAYQQFGAYFAYVAILIWMARQHLLHIVKRAFGRVAPHAGEGDEAMSYPLAFWGFVFSFLFLVGWTCAAGVRIDVAVALWLTYLVVAVGLTRVVVEGGLILVHSGWSPLGPLAYLFGAGPQSWLNPASAVPSSFIGGAIMTEMRGFLLPSFMHSFRLMQETRQRARSVLPLIFAVIVVAFGAGLWQNLRMGYSDGALNLMSWWTRSPGGSAPGQNSQELVKGIQDNFALNWFFVCIGAAATWFIVMARSRFAWFPLHPIGLIMCVPYALHTFWFSIFVGWLCKNFIMRFGGVESYRKATPLFLGVILGDVTMMLFWLAIDCYYGRVEHLLLPR